MKAIKRSYMGDTGLFVYEGKGGGFLYHVREQTFRSKEDVSTW